MWEKVGDRTFSGSPWDSRQPSLQGRGGGSGDWGFWQRAADQRENQPLLWCTLPLCPGGRGQVAGSSNFLPQTFFPSPLHWYVAFASAPRCRSPLWKSSKSCNLTRERSGWRLQKLWSLVLLFSVHSWEKIELHIVWNSWSCRPDEEEKPSSWTDITLKTGRAATSLNCKDDLRTLTSLWNKDFIRTEEIISNWNAFANEERMEEFSNYLHKSGVLRTNQSMFIRRQQPNGLSKRRRLLTEPPCWYMQSSTIYRLKLPLQGLPENSPMQVVHTRIRWKVCNWGGCSTNLNSSK